MSEPIVIPESEKGYQCEVILDSINPAGVRLMTMRWKYPLIVHNELLRHRAFSRSVASNRAIPTEKILAMVEQDPFDPISWGKNQAGMQAQEELDAEKRQSAIMTWNGARISAVYEARELARLGVHKQIANRLLNSFQWVTEVVSATDWANFFALRCDPAAQPEIRRIAEMARKAYETSTPRYYGVGEWHLPFVTEEEWNTPSSPLQTLKAISAARVARTSYRTHAGKISTIEEDLKLYERLVGSQPIHASPTEHQAKAMGTHARYANYRGWRQHRLEIPGHTIEDGKLSKETNNDDPVSEL